MTVNPDTLDKVSYYLFCDEKGKLNKKQVALAERYKDVFVRWLDKPWLSDVKVVNYIQKAYNVSRVQAYNDLSAIKIILGNVRNAEKEWQRYVAIDMVKKAYARLLNADGDKFEIERAKVMIKAAEALGKITMLDKQDVERPNWEEFKSSKFEISSDAELIGWKQTEPIEDTVERLKKKFGYYEDTTIDEAKVLNGV